MKLLLVSFLLVIPFFLIAQDSAADQLKVARQLIKEKKVNESLEVLRNLKQSEASLSNSEKVRFHYNFGECYYRLKQYDKSIQECELGLQQQIENDTIRAKLFEILGRSEYYSSKLVDATTHTNQAKDVYKKLYGVEHRLYRSCLNTLGHFYKTQAKYSKAEKTLQEARQINLRVTGGENIQYAKIINNLANVYSNLNRFDKAGELYETSLRIKELKSGKESVDYANTLYFFAVFQDRLGQFEKAQNTIEEGIAIFTALGETQNKNYPRFLDFLCVLTQKTGNIEEAEKLFKEALQSREAKGTTKTVDYALNLLNLGNLYEDQSQLDKALIFIEKAAPLFETIYGAKHPYYARVLNSLANIQSQQNKDSEAEENYKEAARIIQRSLGRNHIKYFDAQFSHAQFLRKIGKQDEAIDIYKSIEAIPREYLNRVSRFLSEKELYEKVEEYRSFSTEIYSFLREEPDNMDLTSLAYNSTLYYRGFILGNLQRIRQGILKAQEISETSDELTSLHRQLENELNLLSDERRGIDQLVRDIAEKESEIAKALSGYKLEAEAYSWEDVQLALNDDEAAVEYLSFKDPIAEDSIFYGALVLHSDMDEPGYVNLCRESDFAKLLETDGARKADYVDQVFSFAGRGAVPVKEEISLIDLIWNPIKKMIPDANRVFLVSDGLLHRISIGALPTSEETVIADSTELVLFGSTKQVIPDDEKILAYSSNNTLIMGGIVYEITVGESTASRSAETTDPKRAQPSFFKYLPQTEKESKKISSLLEASEFNVNYVYGAEASEKKLVDLIREEPDGFRILHIATHGYFTEQDKTKEDDTYYYGRGMTNSGLALAGANTPGGFPTNDGLLTAYEASRLDLSKTELVVLSACETALGDLVDEEGVYGLQRAFRLAGADKLIMSLWQVEDKATKRFMVTFYENWLEDQSTIREAFQKTQAEMREIGFNPYQWAGFVLLE